MRLLYCGNHEYKDGSKSNYSTEYEIGRLTIHDLLNPNNPPVSIARKEIKSHDDETDTYIITDESAKGLKTEKIEAKK